MLSRIVGYAPGAYDLFHIGHLNILRHARERCDFLVAGVVSDELCLAAKGRLPFIPVAERVEIVRAITFVDDVYTETTPSKLVAWEAVRFDRIFKGDDWRDTPKGEKLQREFAPFGVDVVYLPYTVHTSSTHLRNALRAAVREGERLERGGWATGQ